MSSTLCRRLLHEGHLEPIKQMMNRPFREWHCEAWSTFRTYTRLSNRKFTCSWYPLSGIYAGTVILPDRSRYYSAISVGHRPMAPVPHGMLEAHLLDYDGDLYGKEST